MRRRFDAGWSAGGGAPSLFDVYVVPRSSRPGPDGRHDGLPRLRVNAPPADGKANAEVERRLRDLLGAAVSVVRGGTARVKTCSVELDAEVLAARLTDVFGR
jgi:uncharacterized protein